MNAAQLGTATTPLQIGNPVFAYPFQDEGDAESFTASVEYFQASSEWRKVKPFQVGYTRTFLGRPTYLVRENEPIESVPGFVKWRRTYATVPKTRTKVTEISWTRPGLSTDSLHQFYAITSPTGAGVSFSAFTTSGSHDFSTGDMVLIQFTKRLAATGFTSDHSVRVRVASASGSNFTTAVITAPPGTTLTPVQARLADDGRAAVTLTVACWVEVTYFLLGQNGITTVGDIPLIYPPEIVDANGTIVDAFADTTTPTRTSYLAQVAAGDKIPAHMSTLDNYMGDIIERRTPYVLAQ